MNREILYGFVKYSNPKKGVFLVETGEYKLPVGWVTKEEEALIIGETENSFIKRLLPSSHGEWVGDEVVQRKYIVPIGYHKSRFVRWNEIQLCLFNYNNDPQVNVRESE